jgi:hypothetical protein
MEEKINYYNDGQIEYKIWSLNGYLHLEYGPAYIEYYPNDQIYFKS